MEEQRRAAEILRRLDEHYGTEDVCYLHYEEPWQLLIAVILSAQCTDERVNRVTGHLFARYATPEALAGAKIGELEEEIHSLGFFHNKARHIAACARALAEKYHGQVPETLEELTALPGVGRKTANMIRGVIYHDPSVVVDTHVRRVSKRLGFTREDDPEKIEYDLMQVLPRDHWILYSTQIVTHGRSLCPAGEPRCGQCFLNDLCPSGDQYWVGEYER